MREFCPAKASHVHCPIVLSPQVGWELQGYVAPPPAKKTKKARQCAFCKEDGHRTCPQKPSQSWEQSCSQPQAGKDWLSSTLTTPCFPFSSNPLHSLFTTFLFLLRTFLYNPPYPPSIPTSVLSTNTRHRDKASLVPVITSFSTKCA